jgi:hypothetical protein
MRPRARWFIRIGKRRFKARRKQMRRISLTISALLPVVLLLWAGSRVATGQGVTEAAVKKARLNALYQAYQKYEVLNGEPAKKVEDLALHKDDVEELRRWFDLDELGVSLVGAKKPDLAKMVMASEKDAEKDGGMVLFYDGSIKTLSAAEFKKLVTSAVPVEDKRAPAAKLEQFRGRWSTSREERDGEKVRTSQLALEFRSDQLTFYTEEGGKKGNEFRLQVIGVEQGKEVPYLVLASGQTKYPVYYDFQGERMILVGRLPNRPFEGFSLSGEYRRVEKPK